KGVARVHPKTRRDYLDQEKGVMRVLERPEVNHLVGVGGVRRLGQVVFNRGAALSPDVMDAIVHQDDHLVFGIEDENTLLPDPQLIAPLFQNAFFQALDQDLIHVAADLTQPAITVQGFGGDGHTLSLKGLVYSYATSPGKNGGLKG